MRLKVDRFLAHARMNEDWLADPAAEGPPAVKFAVTGPGGTAAGTESWLVAAHSGPRRLPARLRLEFQQAGVNSLVDDFLHAPTDMDSAGVLSIHYDGHVEHVPVSKNVGKTISLPGSKVSVEVAEYIPNAQTERRRPLRFAGERTERIRCWSCGFIFPGKKEPIRQIAFAKMPFLNLDGIHGRTCPVKFWYHHPAVTPEPGIEFLAAPDGKLYCRVVSERQVPAAGRGQGRATASRPGEFVRLRRSSFYLTPARKRPSCRPRSRRGRGRMAGGCGPDRDHRRRRGPATLARGAAARTNCRK